MQDTRGRFASEGSDTVFRDDAADGRATVEWIAGQPVEIDVDLWSTAMVFNAGHRIRVSVSGSSSPRFEINTNHGGDLDSGGPPVVARPDVLFGTGRPSRLELPVVEAPRRLTGREGR